MWTGYAPNFKVVIASRDKGEEWDWGGDFNFNFLWKKEFETLSSLLIPLNFCSYDPYRVCVYNIYILFCNSVFHILPTVVLKIEKKGFSFVGKCKQGYQELCYGVGQADGSEQMAW